MNKQEEPLETLREIRQMMERSSRFLSLSGLSGVIAGILAIAGVVAGYLYLGIKWDAPDYYRFATSANGTPDTAFYTFLIADLAAVLIVSLLGATWFTVRKAKQQGNAVWDTTAKRLLINLLIPLVAGAIYGLILLYRGHIELIAPATLIFYGMALLNAGKYTFNDIRYLGIFEIVTGLLATVVPQYGLLFWAFGFGVLHIVYGIAVYNKYEK